MIALIDLLTVILESVCLLLPVLEGTSVEASG